MSTKTKQAISSEISLAMCREYAVSVLLPLRFHYFFSDGTDLILEFRSWAIFHLLGLQHVGISGIKKHTLLDKIQNGFDFEDIKKNKTKRKRLADQWERISYFVQIYNILRKCEVVYIDKKSITENSKMSFDYIFFREIEQQGINIGSRFADGVQVPISLFVARKSNSRRYIENGEKKDVQRIEISDIATKEMIEVVEIQKEKTAADEAD